MIKIILFFCWVPVFVSPMDNKIEEARDNIITEINNIDNIYLLESIQKQLHQFQLSTTLFKIYDFLSTCDPKRFISLTDIIQNGDINIVDKENQWYPSFLISIVQEVIKNQSFAHADVVLKKFCVIPFSFIIKIYTICPEKLSEYVLLRVFDFIDHGTDIDGKGGSYDSLKSNYDQIVNFTNYFSEKYCTDITYYSDSIKKIQDIESSKIVWYNFIVFNSFFFNAVCTMYDRKILFFLRN